MTNIDAELVEMIQQLDAESLSTITLLAYAITRKDRKLNAAIKAYGLIPRQDMDDANCEIDYDLLSKIKSVCPSDEGLTWGRALSQCVLRGDKRRVAAIQDLMRLRMAQ